MERRRPVRPKPTKTFSYYSGSVDNRPSPAPEKTINLGGVGRHLRLLPTVLAAVVIIGSILFSLTISTYPVVTVVDDQPSVYRNKDEYAAAVDRLLSGSFGNRTKLTVNTKAVEHQLIEQYPELAAVRLSLPVLGRRPNLVIDVNQPSLLLITSAKVYVLDDTGTAISEAGSLPEDVKQGLLVLRDQSGLAVSVGSQAVTAETVRFIKAVKAQLGPKGLHISELTLPATASQLDIRLEGLSYYIKTDTTGNARLQIGSFLAVKEQRVRPSEYIDVRVEEKVFYR